MVRIVHILNQCISEEKIKTHNWKIDGLKSIFYSHFSFIKLSLLSKLLLWGRFPTIVDEMQSLSKLLLFMAMLSFVVKKNWGQKISCCCFTVWGSFTPPFFVRAAWRSSWRPHLSFIWRLAHRPERTFCLFCMAELNYWANAF